MFQYSFARSIIQCNSRTMISSDQIRSTNVQSTLKKEITYFEKHPIYILRRGPFAKKRLYPIGIGSIAYYGLSNSSYAFTAAEECTSVLVLDHDHTGALMLRAQTLVTLKSTTQHFLMFMLTELNPSSEVYRNLQFRLKTQLVLLCLRRNMDSGLKKNKENCVLRKVLQDHINDIELRMFVETGLNHYYKLFQMKEDAAKAVFFYLTHGTWRTLVERLFLWLRGFCPSELLN
ncbi:hypothetical protein ACSBR2_028406 [Camellia fascicularis]